MAGNGETGKMAKGRKTSYGLTAQQEKEAGRLFGRHVTKEKALAALIATTLCCALPMLLGLRLREEIPETVLTGLTDLSGNDDSLPRSMLVFGIPGLMCVLNLICHVQLWLHQKAETLPPTPVRMMGRWSFSVISVLLCSYWILRGAGRTMRGEDLAAFAVGLLLFLLGGHFFDCTRESPVAFHLKSIEHWEGPWRKTHRLAGLSWMAAGLLLLALRMLTEPLPAAGLIPVLLLMALPIPAAAYFAKK